MFKEHLAVRRIDAAFGGEGVLFRQAFAHSYSAGPES
jgi:hypothetical protein